MNATPRTMLQVKDFFNVPLKGICTDTPSDGVVSPAEFKNFWASLTDAEKEYYKNAEI